MEAGDDLDRQEVIREFGRRAGLHGDLNAVLDAGTAAGTLRQNLLRDYLTRSALFRYLRPGRRDTVLDIGCGVGRLTAAIAGRGAGVTGVDPSLPMIEVARKTHPAVPEDRFIWMEGNSIPLPDGSFSKAFTIWVLQHTPDAVLEQLATEAYRLLRPGGEMVILEQTRKGKKILSPIHVHRTAGEYADAFIRAGFCAVKQTQVIRYPSYAMDRWKRYPFLSAAWLPCFGLLERLTMHLRQRHVEYYTTLMVFRKVL